MEVFLGLRHSEVNSVAKEHKSKSAAITYIDNRIQNLAEFWDETKSSELKSGKAQVIIRWDYESNWWSCIDYEALVQQQK